MEHDQDQLEFRSFIYEKMKERGLTVKKLSELSGIPLKHLENMGRGNFEALPPAPYFRGYLRMLGRILDFDPELWWDHFQKNAHLKRSGGTDELPRNRFAPQPVKKYRWLIFGGVLVIFYFGFRFSEIVGQPVVTIYTPRENISTVGENTIVVAGRVEGSDELFVNSEPVTIEKDGAWQKNMFLEPEMNTIRIVARKFLGRETTVVREVIYRPQSLENATTTSL